MHKLLSLWICVLLQTAAVYAQTSPTHPLRFLVLGDWGRKGSCGQKQVARQMGSTAQAEKIDFVVSVGDNFYQNGVKDTADRHWRKSFERVYDAPALQVPWYVVLGNHDYRGNVQAQLDYGKAHARWQMPERYYALQKSLPGGEQVLLVFMDSNPLMGRYHRDAANYGDLAQQDTAAQLRWLRQTLAGSTARWKLVFGHHPLYTSGPRHSSTHDMQRATEAIFRETGVDAYFCGHEHDLQFNQPDPQGTYYFISGGGSERRPTGRAPFTRFSASERGFMSVALSDAQMTVTIINGKGKVLYTAEKGKNTRY